MINATNTSTTSSTNPVRMPVAERTDRSSEVRQVRDVQRGHHHHAQRGSRPESAERSSEAFATLKIKIQQTVASLVADGTQETDAASTDGAPGPGSEGVLRFSAKIRMSGPNGSLDAQLKMRLDGGSAADESGFAAAIQGFTEALFSALQTLYGGARPALETQPVAPPAAVAAPSSDGKNAAIAAPIVADTAAEGTTTPPPAPAAAESLSPNGSRALSVRLRLSYDAFGSNVGLLVNQLAQPEVSNVAPGMTAWLDDLNERFGQMMSLAPNSGTAPPSLNAFLTALSRSFFGAGSAASTPSDGLAPAGTPALEAPPTDRRFTATAEYRQVLSYGDATASVLLQGSPRSSALYGLA